jgi:hypothetical protein
LNEEALKSRLDRMVLKELVEDVLAARRQYFNDSSWPASG